MSQTLEQNSIGSALVTLTAVSVDFFIKDVKATPDDKLTEAHGGCSRSALAIVSEVVGSLHAFADILAGRESKGMEALVKEFTAQITNGESAAKALEEAKNDALAAISGMADDDWSTTVMAPWGMEATKLFIASFIPHHAAYHDGQLNYIQTINGDGEVHWM
jgi:hypothetical protein